MTKDINEYILNEGGLGLGYKKHVSSVQGRYVGSKRPLKGVFKNTKTGEVCSGDNFDCWDTGKGALDSYKAAVNFFNATLRPHESPREAVSAEWEPEKGAVCERCEFHGSILIEKSCKCSCHKDGGIKR